MRSMAPTGTPRIRTSSPGKMPLLLSKYATTCVLLAEFHNDRATTAMPPASSDTNAMATAILMVRFTVLDPSSVMLRRERV